MFCYVEALFAFVDLSFEVTCPCRINWVSCGNKCRVSDNGVSVISKTNILKARSELQTFLLCFIGNGRGKYAYMEASGRQHGDNVRIISPTMQGPKCMSMMYHMYGSTMGSLIIYMRTNSNETVQWIKSGNHPDRWLKAAVFMNSSVDYQVTHYFNKYC